MIVAVAAVAGTLIGLLLAVEPHEWPYNVIAAGIGCAAVGMGVVLFGLTRVSVAVGTVVAAIIAAMTLYGQVVPETEFGIKGTVTCKNHKPVVGVFVRTTDDKSDFAAWETTGRAFSARYSFGLEERTSFKIGVGCGGTKKKWGDSLSSDLVDYGNRDFVCYTGRERPHHKRGCFTV